MPALSFSVFVDCGLKSIIALVQWSKLKTRIRSRVCRELHERVDFHLTSYRRSHDGADKVWITVDGKRVFSCKHYSSEKAEASAYHDGYKRDEIKPLLAKSEIHSPRGFGDSMREYLDMPIAEALASDDPLIKAFAIIDRRAGKRALAKMEMSLLEHSLVKMFYELRTARDWVN
jgi:hypothetical protein